MEKTAVQWARTAGLATAAIAAPIAAGIAYSAVAINHDVPLSPAIDAERHTFVSPRAGALSYYADERGEGRPLVLVHSINAASSSYEMRPLFERYRGQRPIYALDLPGFGFSERSDRVYSPSLYEIALVDFLRRVAGEEGADVVALSLGSEFAARAALERPDLTRSLALISPTGLSAGGKRNRSERAGERGAGRTTHRLLSVPFWSQAFYDLLTSRTSIRSFLRRSFVGELDRGLAEYGYATAHQPGARFAPLYFISGRLFTPGIRETVYERLAQPVLTLYDRDAFVRFDALFELTQRHPNWRAVRITPSKGLPQFERPGAVTASLDTFWQEVAAALPAAPEAR